MRGQGSIVGADNLRDLVGVYSGHHGELDFVAILGEEPWEAATGGHGVDVQVGVALSPSRDAVVEFVVGHVAELTAPCADGKYGCVSQLCLLEGMCGQPFVAGAVVDTDDNPLGKASRTGSPWSI